MVVCFVDKEYDGLLFTRGTIQVGSVIRYVEGICCVCNPLSDVTYLNPGMVLNGHRPDRHRLGHALGHDLGIVLSKKGS